MPSAVRETLVVPCFCVCVSSVFFPVERKGGDLHFNEARIGIPQLHNTVTCLHSI